MKTNYSDKELLEQRLAGILPVIDIAGHTYIVDLRLKELRAKDEPHNKIRFGNMAMDIEGNNYLCFFHTPSRSVVNIQEGITSVPKDLVMLEIPNELRLDPVGTAREYGLEDSFMLEKYPIRAELKARVIPIDETGLPEVVRANRSKRIRTGIKMKKQQKGKGL